MYSIVVVFLGVIAIWGLYQYKAGSQFRQRTENQYNRSFYEMVGYVQNVEVMLAKAMIANSPEQGISNLSEVWRQANLAQANLGQLPISEIALDNASKFLAQVGDYSYSLVRQNLGGKPLTQKQFDELGKMHDYSAKMTENLAQVEADLGQGRLKWGELSQKGQSVFQRTSKNFTTTKFENIEKQFKEYPRLIYDGPFSDGLEDMKPQGLTGDKLNQGQAKAVAVAFLGANKVHEINSIGSTNSTIKTHNFQVTLKNAPKDTSATISITEKGGHPLLMTDNRAVTKEVINVKQAKETGRKFLESRGFKNMVDTYYLKEDGVATINYAYSENNIVMYPDLIKVKVALDNGEILGFESRSYLTTHRKRNFTTPKITVDEARKKINPRLKIESSGLVVIPTKWKSEILTYEFKGKVDGRDFLVYINADNGKEEDILLIINTPNGILTM